MLGNHIIMYSNVLLLTTQHSIDYIIKELKLIYIYQRSGEGK